MGCDWGEMSIDEPREAGHPWSSMVIHGHPQLQAANGDETVGKLMTQNGCGVVSREKELV